MRLLMILSLMKDGISLMMLDQIRIQSTVNVLLKLLWYRTLKNANVQVQLLTEFHAAWKFTNGLSKSRKIEDEL